MNRVVRHVEVERLPIRNCLFHGGDRFAGDGFREVDFLSVVFFETGDIPDVATTPPLGREVLIAVIGTRAAHVRTRDVDVEAQIARICTGRVLGTKMSLARVDRAVTVFLEDLRQCAGLDAPGHIRSKRLQPVQTPAGRPEPLVISFR